MIILKSPREIEKMRKGTGQEKFKNLSDGSTARYIYYGCTRGKDRDCKNVYIREEDLIKELIKIIDQVEIDHLGAQGKFEEEIRRLNNLQTSVLGEDPEKIKVKKIDVRAYAKYLLRDGSITEKRELLSLLKSKLIYTNRKIQL